MEEWNQNCRKWCLEQTYNGKGTVGKKESTKEKRKGMNEEGKLKVVTEKKRSLARLGNKKSV